MAEEQTEGEGPVAGGAETPQRRQPLIRWQVILPWVVFAALVAGVVWYFAQPPVPPPKVP